MAATDDALKALDDTWRPAKEIFQRVGCGSQSGINHALDLLASQKLAEIKAAPPHGTVRTAVYVYRIAQSR